MWIYVDNKIGEVVFQCDGDMSLIEADLLYAAHTGKDPIKQMYVGVYNTQWSCYVKKI